jgi:hypothetical protein
VSVRTLHKPPAPDPCIVSSSLVSGYFFNRSREKAMVKARNCPYGCGLVCKGLLPLPSGGSSE